MNGDKLIKFGLLAAAGWFAFMLLFSQDSVPGGMGNGNVMEWTYADLESKGKRGYVVVDCYTTTCGPCRRMAPIMEELAKEFASKATFAKIDVARNNSAGSALRVSVVPTFIFFRNGIEIDRLQGSMEKDEMRQILENKLR